MHTSEGSQNIFKVVVIGPECTGKTELSAFLANHYETVFVEEYAREFLNSLGRPYDRSDLVAIATGQLGLEDQQTIHANKVLICDTNAIVIKVWSEFKYGNVDPAIIDLIATRVYNLYLLTFIDIPWTFDPLREHPNARHELWEMYQREIKNTNVPFAIVKGVREERQSIAIQAIDRLLSVT